MIYPSVNDLSKDGKYNRYTLVIAASKCARILTDEYVKQREYAEKLIANKETDKSLISMIKREYRDEKAVKSAINKLYEGEFIIGSAEDAAAMAAQSAADAPQEEESKEEPSETADDGAQEAKDE
jgi:DNA-directed RNA polymerase subunit K/omega